MIYLYCQVNLLLTLSFLAFFCVQYTNLLSERQKLTLGYTFISLSVFLPLLSVVWGEDFIDLVPLEFSRGQSPEVLDSVSRSLSIASALKFTPGDLGPTAVNWIEIVMYSAICFSFVRFSFFYLRLSHYIQGLPVLKKYRSIAVLFDARAHSGYSMELLRRAYVVLPFQSLDTVFDRRQVLRHEFQHLRNHDTRWVHFLFLLRGVFVWNPIIYFLVTRLEKQQEFACDEAVVASGEDAYNYGEFLFRSAQILGASKSKGHYELASYFFKPQSSHLRRRIRMILRYANLKPIESAKTRGSSRWIFFIWILSFLVLSVSVYALQGPRSLSKEDAKRLAESASQKLGFDIQLTPGVYEKLNLFVGTNAGRKFFSESMQRMKQYEPAILSEITNRKMPKGFLAIPLIESGYRNLDGPKKDGEYYKIKNPPSVGFHLESESLAPGYRGAGLWMFIPETAKVYGLRVDDQVDERRDLHKSTSAALRLLENLKKDLGSWPLAVAAYNQGVRRVKSRVRELETTDAWVLNQKGAINDYLNGVAAAMVVLAHPELVR